MKLAAPDDQAKALLDQVAEYQRAECQRLLADARLQGGETLDRAHRKARARMHRVIEEERERGRRELGRARAELETLRRQHLQRYQAAMLREGWQRLASALERRWKQATTREQWVLALVTEASRLLPGGTWRILHPPDFPDQEKEALTASLAGRPGGPPDWTPDPKVHAGLIICEQGTCVDGSLAGLMADRTATEAELLALIVGGEGAPA